MKYYKVILNYLEEDEANSDLDVLVSKQVGTITEDEYAQRMYGDERFECSDLDPDSSITYELIKQ